MCDLPWGDLPPRSNVVIEKTPFKYLANNHVSRVYFLIHDRLVADVI